MLTLKTGAVRQFMGRCSNEVADVMYMMCYANLADKRVAENMR